MLAQPIQLTPDDVAILVSCPLHYYFRRQQTGPAPGTDLDHLVRQAIYELHAAGGPGRVSLRRCLSTLQHQPAAQRQFEPYYERLRREWPQVIASNETMALKITIAGVALRLRATVDRIDKTSDGGVVAIFIRTGTAPLPTAADLRRNPAHTIHHALVATAYPLKRPVRLQELWLHHNQAVTVEFNEHEYRHNLSRLREPARDLARGQVQARPGLHCDQCPFKHHGCPVYAHQPPDFESSSPDGKISQRRWIYDL
jgi:RecB family exonuclease